MARPVRIVVGEGRAAQKGLLRFVLEGEGFDVVGEARGTADLTEVIESNEPDVVVLDDGIGVIAVSMVHEVAPQAKVVLVWPSAVVPIGGDARVEPARILRDLGPAVTQVMAPAAALTETFERPGWVEKVRKDPTALREKLVGKETTKRPSVTRLQRRGKRLHPTGSRSAPAQRDREEEERVPAPVVVLPVGAGGADLEPVLDIGGGAAGTESGDAPVEERSEWNRRLGTLALSGAAAVSALVLALALNGGRLVPVSVIRGGGQVPVGVPGIVQNGQTVLGPYGSGTLGGGGYDPTVVNEPSGPDEGGKPFGEEPIGGDLASPGGSGGRDEPAPVVNPGPDDGTGGGNGGNGGGGNGGGGNGGGGNGGGGNGGGGGNDGGTPGKGGKSGGKHKSPPGKSGEHNPHGGPPGHMGDTPAHGPGLGVGFSAEHSSHRHAHKH